MLPENVVKLDNTIVYEQIQRFLSEKENKSKGTKDAYEYDIRLFFKTVKNKEIFHLTEQDVQMTLEEILDFRNYLKNLKDRKKQRIYTNKTINRKITAIKEVIKFLSAVKNNDGEYIIKDYAFLSLIAALPEDENHYDAFEPEEVEKLAKLALDEKISGKEKSLYLRFLLHTGLRKAEALNVEWKDFRKYNDKIIQLKGTGKGNKTFKKFVLLDFYNELLEIKTNDSVKVFNISSSTVQKMFERVMKKLDLQEEDHRNLVIHSIRKAYGTHVYNIYNDIDLTRKAMGHSNIATTQLYLGSSKDEELLSSLVLMDKVDKDLYKNIESEILLRTIDSMPSDFKLKLNNKIMEIIGTNQLTK